MAPGRLAVASPLFGVKRGDKIVIGDAHGTQAVRVVSRSGDSLTFSLDVTPWRWYHTVAAWPRRAWRRSRTLAEDLYYRLRPVPEDEDGWPLP